MQVYNFQRVIVYLASIIRRRKVDKINDDLFNFIKERYFVGESVEVNIGKTKVRRFEVVWYYFYIQNLFK